MAREFKLGKEIEGTLLTPIRFAEMRHWPKFLITFLNAVAVMKKF